MPKGSTVINTEQKRQIATGVLVSDVFDGVDPGYMLADSLLLSQPDPAGKYILEVTLHKVIDEDVAKKIINTWRGVNND